MWIYKAEKCAQNRKYDELFLILYIFGGMAGLIITFFILLDMFIGAKIDGTNFWCCLIGWCICITGNWLRRK